MTAVIHQAYFMPWLGYFSKLAFADEFIVLDDVLFRKRFFHDRAKIINMHGEVNWIGLPVGQNYKLQCRNVVLKEGLCVEAIITTISQSYARANHYESEMPWLANTIRSCIAPGRSLVEINVSLILSILSHLNIRLPRILRSGDFLTDSDPTQRVIELCQKANVSDLIVGTGKSHVVHNWGQVEGAGIRISKQDFLSHHPNYVQSRRKYSGFQAGLSTIDSILNVGREQTRAFLIDTKMIPTFNCK